MPEQLTVSKDFLQRALGFGEGGDPQTVGIFPGKLSEDFPLTLPDLPGLRVVGSVRNLAPRWSFGREVTAAPEQRQWRIFLDVAADLPTTMRLFQDSLRAAGWEAVRQFRQVFVDAEQPQWLAVHPSHSRQVSLYLRRAGEDTQVWLNLHDLEPQAAEHLLGGHPQFDHYEAPLPTLRLPPGWRGQMQQGSGGPVHSQEYILSGPVDVELLAHLLPQFAEQGWALLHREDGLSVFRTALGIGTLLLTGAGGNLTAHIVHVTGEKGSGSRLRTVAHS